MVKKKSTHVEKEKHVYKAFSKAYYQSLISAKIKGGVNYTNFT